MPKMLKTRSELAELMMQMARSSGKCGDLDSVVILGPSVGGNANWDFGTAPTSPSLVKPACQQELREIAGKLQPQFDLSGR